MPPLVTSIVAITSQLIQNATGKVAVSELANSCILAGLGLIAAAILTSAVFT
jgi:hypothetical protein